MRTRAVGDACACVSCSGGKHAAGREFHGETEGNPAAFACNGRKWMGLDVGIVEKTPEYWNSERHAVPLSDKSGGLFAAGRDQ